MTQLYDTIGKGYGLVRRPDPYWRQQIEDAIGDCDSLINVGAGTGSYEPQAQRTIAVEPSFTMIKQRSVRAAPAVQAVAEALPIRDESFSAALSVLSVHHWKCRQAAFEEIGRVATRRAVFVTWDPDHEGYWLTQDYFPDIAAIDQAIFPPISEFRSAFGGVDIIPLLVPHNCADGFLGAYWRRPHAYLESEVRDGMSTFAKLDDTSVGLARLRSDLESGQWYKRNRTLMYEDRADLGYRIVIAEIQ